MGAFRLGSVSRHARREAALVVAGFVALAVFWTWPLAQNQSRVVEIAVVANDRDRYIRRRRSGNRCSGRRR